MEGESNHRVRRKKLVFKREKRRGKKREVDGKGKWQIGTMRGSPSICLKATACPVGREPECVHSGLNNGCSQYSSSEWQGSSSGTETEMEGARNLHLSREFWKRRRGPASSSSPTSTNKTDTRRRTAGKSGHRPKKSEEEKTTKICPLQRHLKIILEF